MLHLKARGPRHHPGADAGSRQSGRRDLLRDLFRWLATTSSDQSDEMVGKLIQTVLDRKAALVFGALNTAATALTTAWITGEHWPFAWLSAELVLLALRLGFIAHSESPQRWPAHAYVPAMLTLGLIWMMLFAAGAMACVLSGHAVLAVIGGIGTAGVAAAVSSRNAATPRYGGLVIIIGCVPYAVGALYSPFPGMLMVALLMPFWGAGLYVLLLQNHEITVRMIQAELVTRRLAMTDSLTGLGNRMLLDTRLAAICARSERNPGTRASLLCLDLDGFKAVNDRYGHAAGDVLLKSIAKRVLGAIREQDTACRQGGDEFAVILDNATAEETSLIAGRILQSVSSPFEIGLDEKVRVGVSIGSARTPEHGADPAALVAAADAALYAAKRAGRGLHHEYVAKDIA